MEKAQKISPVKSKDLQCKGKEKLNQGQSLGTQHGQSNARVSDDLKSKPPDNAFIMQIIRNELNHLYDQRKDAGRVANEGMSSGMGIS